MQVKDQAINSSFLDWNCLFEGLRNFQFVSEAQKVNKSISLKDSCVIGLLVNFNECVLLNFDPLSFFFILSSLFYKTFC